MNKIYMLLFVLFFSCSLAYSQEGEIENEMEYSDSMMMRRLADTIPTASIFSGTYRSKEDSVLESKAVLLVSKAYLLSGPSWDDVIVEHLKAGSRVFVENSHNGWSYVLVYSEPGNEEIRDKRVSGFINNKALGLNKKGKPLKKQ
jgi:uncharacterized protein YgiM (DUF1202 family)